MKGLTYTLYGFAIVATLLTAVVFVQNVRVFDPNAPVITAQVPAEKEVSSQSFFSWMLSKLSLQPFRRHKTELVAFMVENHQAARPHHEGLSSALMIEEFLVEGYISRFVVLFERDKLPKRVGPIRSLRPYFVDAIIPWVHAIVHAGGSPEAFERVQTNDEIVNINGLALGDARHRDSTIPAPHNFYFYPDQVEAHLPEQLPKTQWPPFVIGSRTGESTANTLDIDFHSVDHNVTYTYNEWRQTYTRINGGMESDAHPRNVLLLEMPITGTGEYGRLTIPVEGSGRAVLFRTGGVQEGRWKKDGQDDAFAFELENGDPMHFAWGQVWMTVLPSVEDRASWE